MVTRAARPGPAGDPAGEDEHLQLTTLAGWRGFVTEMPAVPDLLPEAIWTGLERGKRACYDDDRIDHHSRLLVVQTPTIRQVINSGRRLIQLNKNTHYGRCGLMVSGPARTGKTTALTQLGKTIEVIHRRRHPRSGIALIAITYSLLSQQLNASAPPWHSPPGTPTDQTWAFIASAQLNEVIAHQRAVTLHQLVVQAAIALAFTTALAAAAGWFVSARALRPLRSVTATAHRLSQRNLNERIALRGPRDEIKELADTFDEMLGRLAAAFDAQRRFVANASHELRTPLTRLRTLIDVSLADPDADAAALRTMAERIQAAAEDQERLIDGLLTLAQGERGLDRAQPIDLADLVTSVLPATASRHSGPHQPQVLTELGPAATSGDRDLLARLVANLIDNALSYNIADGWVRIRTGYQDGQATLQVTNTGPVLPDEVVPMLLEPFRRQVPDRTSTSTRRGSGLGLSIVAAITDAHGGTIDLAAQEGGGLQITVGLPAQPSARQQHGR